jgi:hypothetical protein
MNNSGQRSAFYSALILDSVARPLDPADLYCLGCGNQHHECICDDLPSYGEVRDHPSLYREGTR